MNLKYISAFLFAVLSLFSVCSYAAGNLNVRDISEYFKAEKYKYNGVAPYLAFSKEEVRIMAYSTTAKFVEDDNAVLDIIKDGKETIKQINFMVSVCNHRDPKRTFSGELDPDLMPLLNKNKSHLQTEVKKAVEHFYNEKIPEDYFNQFGNTKKYKGKLFDLRYKEMSEKCDAMGGSAAMFSIFPHK